MLENLDSLISKNGLPIVEVGHWAEGKYKLIQHYASQFVTSMKSKWNARVYIDLFAGCGASKIKNTTKVLPASPLVAMNIKDPFDKYIFCDIDEEKLDTLKNRQKKLFPELSVEFISGDVNTNVSLILQHIPQWSKDNTVLTFCLVDPYNLSNLHFNTILQLSNIFIDFLVLIPTFMDAKRNLRLNYLKPDNQTIDLFLGDPNWREDWEHASNRSTKFERFLVTKFSQQMKSLKFLTPDPDDIFRVKIKDKNVPLYHLVFYSRNPLGMKFWKNAVIGTSEQYRLF
jgi:three-Cys-motif partner protein